VLVEAARTKLGYAITGPPQTINAIRLFKVSFITRDFNAEAFGNHLDEMDSGVAVCKQTFRLALDVTD
jgi:hypothetical protein